MSNTQFNPYADQLEIYDVVEWVVGVKKIASTAKHGQPKWMIILDDGEIVATLIMTTQQIIKNEKTFSGMLLLEMGHRMVCPTEGQWKRFLKHIGDVARGGVE